MFYVYHATTPANTAKADKIITPMQLAMGGITKVEILFPPGCAGLVYCGIWDALHQLWPTNPDGYFQSAKETISLMAGVAFVTEPFVVYAHTWNLDDTYEHTLTFRFEVLPLRMTDIPAPEPPEEEPE